MSKSLSAHRLHCELIKAVWCIYMLTHWGRVTHICVSKLITIGSDNGLSPGRRQAIIWTSAGILLIGPLRIIFSECLIEIPTFSFRKMHLKMSSGKWQSFCLGLNVLMNLVISGSDKACWVVAPLCKSVMAYRILGTKFQWNFSRNSNTFISENEFANVIWKTMVICCCPTLLRLSIK